MIGGEMFAIRRIHKPYIVLWRGYHPNIEYTVVDMKDFRPEEYCDKAVKMLER
jgi:hypothetical protein